MQQFDKQTRYIINPAQTRVSLILLLLLLILPPLIYLPGINGPFLLDDLPNFVQNKSVHINNLSLTTLQEAANSLISSILGRPVAALSFAFNYYLVDGADSPYGFKLFNIIIHTINGFLIFWLTRLIFIRLQAHPAKPLKELSTHQASTLLAGFCALLWVCHPIQLTSVLYVVQRMTSMAALFMLLAMIAYLKARTTQQVHKRWSWFLTIPLWGLLAVYSKESGFLLPLYLLILELLLFPDTFPWKYWPKLKQHSRWLIIFGTGLLSLFLVVAAVRYSLPAYAPRDFNLLERIFTEARVLVFYIGQILIPRLSAFGLYHDDFVLSHNLFEPWTTLPAILIITTLVLFALLTLRRQPLLSLGLLWFFASHALESTVYPFELIFEHRNYLASLGMVFIIIQGILWLYSHYRDKRVWLLTPFIVIILAANTAIRSYQWQDIRTLLYTHVENHPESPRAWGHLSNVYASNNNYMKSVAALRMAILLDPREPGYLVHLYMHMERLGLALPDIEQDNTIKAIKKYPHASMLVLAFHKINSCIDLSCQGMQNIFETWLRAALESSNSPRYQYYLGNTLAAQGKFDEGLKYINYSIHQAPNHLSPYIGKIDILLKQGKTNEANSTYDTLEVICNKLNGTLTDKVLEAKKRISESEQALIPAPHG